MNRKEGRGKREEVLTAESAEDAEGRGKRVWDLCPSACLELRYGL
ncbi:hypothetical protein [Microcoleus sp. herbarium5]